MNEPIQFGTDGWRAVIAETFTFENVQRAAQATADYFKTVENVEPGVFIGFDGRFMSGRFAAAAAEVFAGNQFRVVLMDRPYPTPYVSFETRRQRFAGGVVITASHNPAPYNGFKVKAFFGGSATPDITKKIEENLGKRPVARATNGISAASPENAYFEHLKGLVDWDRITGSNLKIVVDSMHGAGARILETMLAGASCSVETIRGSLDPLFGGVNPEPMMPQLQPLAERVRQTGSHIGLATDGDADRVGAVDETGEFLSTIRTLPLLLLHAYRNRGWRGSVARTYSQSQLVDRIASSLGLTLYERPIGFKNIAEIMLREEVLIGGEESGGIGLSRHMPERDGIFINLLTLDMLAASGKTCSSLIRDVWKEFGEFHYDRSDLHIPRESGKMALETLNSTPPLTLGGKRVKNVGSLDGSKVFLDGEAWILFRASGTEDLLRVYCEAPSQALVSRIMQDGLRFVEQFTSRGVQ
jgi:phosphomannomutase